MHLAPTADATLRTDKNRRVIDKTVRPTLEDRPRDIDVVALCHVLHPSDGRVRKRLRQLHVPRLDTVARTKQLRQDDKACSPGCGSGDHLCRVRLIRLLVVEDTIHLYGCDTPFMRHSLTSYA